MTFDEFQQVLLQLAHRVEADGFKVEGIVAVARGGWIPALMLAKFLGVKRIYSFGVTYTNPERNILSVYSAPFPTLRNQRLLLVEDFLETAKSIVFVKNILQENGNDVRTFAAGYLSQSILIPDYTNGVINNIPHLPWD